MKESHSIRILVADDHPVVVSGLSAVISAQTDMTVVAAAENGQQSIDLFGQYLPDITLMDIRMPVISGIEATLMIRKEHPQARIIVLTSYDGDEDIHRALKAGAKAYLLKNAPQGELVRAIREVHAGRHYLSQTAASHLANRLSLGDLTSREVDVLELMVKGMNNKEIAATLQISVHTVKLHVRSILGKLGASDRTQAVTTALQRGIVHLR